MVMREEKMMKIILSVIPILFLLNPVSGYYIGYEYGLNKTLINEVLSEVPEEYFNGLTNIYFTTAQVRFRGQGSGEGVFEFWDCGKTRITIGMFDNMSRDRFKFVLLHELGHLHELMGKEKWYEVYMLSEDYANDFAYKNWESRR